jgi:tetratricopeptide (TPR) repeat protein
MRRTRHFPSYLSKLLSLFPRGTADIRAVVAWSLARAHAFAPVQPPRAVALARLGIALATRVQRRRGAWDGRLLFLTADGFREKADALARRERFGDAARAALRARALFADPRVAPFVTAEEARLSMTYSWILFCQGRTAEAFETIGRAGDFLLRERNDITGFVKARAFEAAIHVGLEQFEQGHGILRVIVKLAETSVDGPTFDSIISNAAICAGEVGDERAEALYEFAVSRLRAAGRHAEVLRVQTFRARQFELHGRLDESIAAYEAISDGYLALGMPESAAHVSKPIVRMYLEQGRTAEALARGRKVLEVLSEAQFERAAAEVRELVERCEAQAKRSSAPPDNG